MELTCLCPKEVASQLGVSERTAQRAMRNGDIEAFRVGPKLWRCTQGDIADYVVKQYERYRRPVRPAVTDSPLA